MRILTKAALGAAGIAAASAIGACTDGYGYSGVSVGAGYYDSGWGDPYWGWYDSYYYPGVGFYVYDSNRRRHRWTEGHRRYWEGRRNAWRGERRWRENWRDFRRDGRRDRRRR